MQVSLLLSFHMKIDSGANPYHNGNNRHSQIEMSQIHNIYLLLFDTFIKYNPRPTKNITAPEAHNDR